MARRRRQDWPDAANHLKTPRRYINKRGALRHLVHSAIRLTLAGEDPFAIHLLIQSGEKLVRGIANKAGVLLRLDFDPHLKGGTREEFYYFWRIAYNYFKHAEHDADIDLGVHDIHRQNILALLVLSDGFGQVYGSRTAHVQLYMVALACVMPARLELFPGMAEVAEEARRKMKGLTIGEYFGFILETAAQYFPDFETERREDLVDLDEVRSADVTKTLFPEETTSGKP
jgi:hypothetical protein